LTSARFRIRYVTVFLLIVALFSTISPAGHAATSPSASVQHDALVFTVNPDKSVGIDWNTTTYSSILQNQSSVVPAGSPIRYSSSFAQQSSGLVETTTFQYAVPQQVYTNLVFNSINSINLTASKTGQTEQGSLTFTSNLPLQQLTILFTVTPSEINANATSQIIFSSYSPYNETPFANETIWNNTWSKTFGNQTYTDTIASQIQNSTAQILYVKNLNGTNTPTPSSTTAVVKFIAVPGGAATSFLAAFENIVNPFTKNPTALDNLIQSVQNLVTGETTSLTYSAATKIVNFKSTITFVSDLDAQINSIKNQYLQLILNKTGPNPPQDTFLNSTSVTLSKSSMTSNIDLNAGTYTTSLSGTSVNPQVVAASNNNFTIPGMFQTVGSSQPHGSGLNITLVGGSDSNNQVKVVVPTGTQLPSSTTSNSATWLNVQNASALMNVQFQIQPKPFSLITFLTSTTGFVIEGIIAALVIAGIAVAVRKRHSKTSMPVTPSGPTTTPGFGPSPAPTQQERLS
jgi:hypothetical protein